MLVADKDALETELVQSVVELQAKELNYLLRNLQNIAVASSVLVGFGFSGLSLYKSDDLDTNLSTYACFDWTFFTLNATVSTHPEPTPKECVVAVAATLIDAVFQLNMATALSFNLLATLISTLAAITGPGLALRGPEGSLGVALTLMEQQNKRALRFFGRGLVSFAFGVICFAFESFATLSFLKGGMVLGVGVWTLYQIMIYSADIGVKFFMAVNTTVRGEFDDRPADPSDEVPTMRQFSFFSMFSGGRKQSYFSILWRLDRMVVLPYHQLYARNTSHRRFHGSGDVPPTPLNPSFEARGLIHRLQGRPAPVGPTDAEVYAQRQTDLSSSFFAFLSGGEYSDGQPRRKSQASQSWWPWWSSASKPKSTGRSRKPSRKMSRKVSLDVQLQGQAASGKICDARLTPPGGRKSVEWELQQTGDSSV